MTYALEDVARDLHAKLDDWLTDDIEIVTSTQLGRMTRVRLYRRVSWMVGVFEHGGTVDAEVSIDNASVMMKINASPQKEREWRHGVENAVQATLLALGFITSKDGGLVMQVHARYGRPPKVHELKCWPEHFRPIMDGSKTFEWRKDDRGEFGFRVGDILYLREWEPSPRGWDTADEGKYTSNSVRRVVTHLLKDRLGLPEGYVIMSLGPMP